VGQSRPDSGLGFQVEFLENIWLFPFGSEAPRNAGLLHGMNASFYYFALPRVFFLGIRAKLTALRGNFQELSFKRVGCLSRARVAWRSDCLRRSSPLARGAKHWRGRACRACPAPPSECGACVRSIMVGTRGSGQAKRGRGSE